MSEPFVLTNPSASPFPASLCMFYDPGVSDKSLSQVLSDSLFSREASRARFLSPSTPCGELLPQPPHFIPSLAGMGWSSSALTVESLLYTGALLSSSVS